MHPDQRREKTDGGDSSGAYSKDHGGYHGRMLPIGGWKTEGFPGGLGL